MKKCPYCAEEIQDEAIFCRYCNHELSPSQRNTTVNTQKNGNAISEKTLKYIEKLRREYESLIAAEKHNKEKDGYETVNLTAGLAKSIVNNDKKSFANISADISKDVTNDELKSLAPILYKSPEEITQGKSKFEDKFGYFYKKKANYTDIDKINHYKSEKKADSLVQFRKKTIAIAGILVSIIAVVGFISGLVNKNNSTASSDANISNISQTTKASTTTVASTTSVATTTSPKEDLTNPVCLEYFLWDNYEKTYTDGSESITFAYQEPDDGASLRSTYPDIQYIANYRPGTELHFRVYKDREEAIARGVKIKFEANDMIFSGGTGSNPKYTGLINGIGYYTGIEWVYDGSLVEERFDIWFENSAVIGMNPYIKVTISTDGYKNKTFNIKVNRAENYHYKETEASYSPDFYAGFTQVYSGEEEYTPRIVLNSDGTFGFLCNHLNGMATYLGTWDYTMEGRDTFIVRMHVTSNNRYEPVNAEISNTTMYLKFKSGEEYAEYSDDSYERYGYLVFGESSMPNSRFHIDYLEPVF